LAVRVARVFVLLASVIVALGIVELVVRIYQGDSLLPLIPPEPYVDNAVLYEPSPTRLYMLRPGVDAVVSRSHVHIHINAAGFRDDREWTSGKLDGGYRIVVLGDSFTFGGKVEVEKTFPCVLEKELQNLDPSQRYEALNLAVPGYNTEQEMLTLREEGLAYQPDLVIVNFVLNDAGPMEQLFPRKSSLPLSVRRILKRSDLVQFVYAFEKGMRIVLLRGSFQAASHYAELAEGSPGWDRARAALAEIQQLCSSTHTRLLVVVWPMLVDLRGDYPYGAKHQLVVDECRRLGIPVLDLLPTFAGQEPSALWASRRDHHPNAIALKRAADAVLRDLAARGMVPSAVAQAVVG
jgi:lysophospholipase L1-like esterase